MSSKRKAILKKAMCALTALFFALIFAAPVAAAPEAYMIATAPNNPFSLKVEQVFTAAADSEALTYTYRLRPYDKDAPMPEGSADDVYEFKITGTDSIYIGEFRYNKPGVYKYDLNKDTEKCKPGHTHNKRKYTIEVYVSPELLTGVVVMNEDGTKADAILFESNYEALPGPADPGNPPLPGGAPGNQINSNNLYNSNGGAYKTGDEMNIILFMILLTAGGLAAFWLTIYLREHKTQ